MVLSGQRVSDVALYASTSAPEGHGREERTVRDLLAALSRWHLPQACRWQREGNTYLLNNYMHCAAMSAKVFFFST